MLDRTTLSKVARIKEQFESLPSAERHRILAVFDHSVASKRLDEKSQSKLLVKHLLSTRSSEIIARIRGAVC